MIREQQGLTVDPPDEEPLGEADDENEGEEEEEGDDDEAPKINQSQFILICKKKLSGVDVCGFIHTLWYLASRRYKMWSDSCSKPATMWLIGDWGLCPWMLAWGRKQ